MKIIKTKWFTKWAEKNYIYDETLIKSSQEIINNKYEVDYGSGVIKKRIASKGRGKSGSVRTIVAYKKAQHCFFIYGFEKSAKSNISKAEEKALKIIAKQLLDFSETELLKQFNSGALVEVDNEKK